jgi:hypothetical protein
MTDGAAFLLKKWKENPTTKDKETTDLVYQVYDRLTSRDPS